MRGISGPEAVAARGHCNHSLLRTGEDTVRNVLRLHAAGGHEKRPERWVCDILRPRAGPEEERTTTALAPEPAPLPMYHNHQTTKNRLGEG